MKEILSTNDVILPGHAVHHVFRVRNSTPLEVSVIDRQHEIGAQAVHDGEGWCVIILTNLVGVPVVISPEEPLRLVIVPEQRIAVQQVRDMTNAEIRNRASGR